MTLALQQRKAWADLGLTLLLLCFLGQGRDLEAVGEKLPLAYDPESKRFLITYHKKGKGLKGRLLDAQGKQIGSGFVVSESAPCCDDPLVAFDEPNQRFLVVWMQQDGT